MPERSQASPAVVLERRGAVLEVTLDRPPVNAIDAATSVALGNAFFDFRDDPELRVAILSASGERFFCVGMDLKAAAAGETIETHLSVSGFGGLTELFDLDKPVIAAVNGAAIGGGWELVLACDLCIAADHAEFSIPDARLGLVPDGGGVQRLPRLLPRPVALEVLLAGRRLSAAEAAHFGLVNAVVPTPDVLPRARELADALADAAPLAVRATKEVIRGTEHLSVREAFERIRSGDFPAFERMKNSEDAREGLRAFVEKRPPVFRGA